MAISREEYIKLRKQGKSQDEITQMVSNQSSQSSNAPPSKGLPGFATGVGQGVLSTVLGAGQLGQKVLQNTAGRVVEKITGQKKETIGADIYQPKRAEEIRQQHLTPQTPSQKIGFAIERVAEIVAPSSKIAALEKGATMLGSNLLARSTIEAAAYGGMTTIQKGGVDKDAKTAALIGAMFPVAGAALKATKQLVGKSAVSAGQKIQFNKIKPSAKDFEDGFEISNVIKHKLNGRNAEEVYYKTQDKMNQLAQEALKRSKSTDIKVNLMSAYDRTVKSLTGNKAKTFGENSSTKRVLDRLKIEVDDVALQRDGIVTLPEAIQAKRGAGIKGAWTFGSPDPDATAVEKVYTSFYQQLRKEIRGVAPLRISQIDDQLTEIIPVARAALRRIPVESRNAVLSLTDSMGLFAAAFDPKALVALGAKKLSESGTFSNFLIKFGQTLGKEPGARSAVGERFLGGNIKDLKNIKSPPIGLSIKDVSGMPKTAIPDKMAKLIDKTDARMIKEFLDNPQDINAYMKLDPILRGMGIQKADTDMQRRFLEEVWDASKFGKANPIGARQLVEKFNKIDTTKAHKVLDKYNKSNYLKGKGGLFKGSKPKKP